MKGNECMKCLRIKDGKGEFSLDGTAYSTLDKVTKDDIMKLLELSLDTATDFEMDVYDAELFTNPAHRVIYSNLYEKFISLNANKSQFTSEVEALYSEAFDKYKLDPEEVADEV